MISPHILVVGSDPAIMRSVTAMLAETSCRAEESAMGADAVAKLHCSPAPDLVLLEFGNGNHTAGLQVLQEMRTIRPELAVVVLLASSDTRQVVESSSTWVTMCSLWRPVRPCAKFEYRQTFCPT